MNDPFDVELKPSTEAIDALVEQATELVNLENEIACCEAYLKTISGRANELKTQVIPDKMAEIGLDRFRMKDGAEIRVDDFVSGTLPKDADKKESALAFLEEHGADKIVKSAVTMEFGKEEHNEALAIAADLRERGFEVTVDSKVHPQTYLACMREFMREGVAIDPERMGIFIGRRARVVAGK